jgi:UDP-glucose 4-epimerase
MPEETPLMAAERFSEMRDLIELDMYAQSFMWKHPELETVILRPVNIVGPTVKNAPSNYLRLERPLTVLGFDPMVQLVHEEDVCRALALALRPGLRGVFNVTGPGEVPLHTAIRETGGTAVPMPEPLMRPVFDRMFRLGLIPYPAGAIDYLKFPVTLSGQRFVEATNFRCLFGLEEIFQSLRR